MEGGGEGGWGGVCGVVAATSNVQLEVPQKHERDCLSLWSKEEDSLARFGRQKLNLDQLGGFSIINDILINNVGEEQHSHYLFDLTP